MSASKWKQYPNYKKIGNDWFDKIPDEWNIVKIRRITSEHKQGYYTEQDYINDGIKLVRITDITDDADVDFSKMPFVSITDKEFSDFMVKSGDFLFARSGTIGRFGLVQQAEDSVFASYIIRFRFKEIDSDFMKIYLLSSVFKEQLISSLHGGANKNIHAENIKDVWIAKPSYSEQRAIFDFVNPKIKQINETIKGLESEIVLLEEKRSALITKAVTKGLNADVEMKDSENKSIGKIPAHWEIITAKHLENNSAELVQTGPFGAQLHASDYIEDEVNGIPLILIKNVRDLKISSHDIPRISLDKAESLSLYRLKRDDIVFSRVGSVGRIAKVSQNEVGWLISGQMLRLRFTTNRINTDYAVYSISSKPILNYFELQSVGTTRDSINSTILSEMPMIVPPVEEQEKIVNYLNEKTTSFRKIMGLISQQLVRLAEYRKALISAAVTGKIDVRSL